MTADGREGPARIPAGKDCADADGYRALRCPRCGRRMIDVALGSTGSIRARCRKCKFEGILDLGRFRRQGRRARRARIRYTEYREY